MQKTKKVLDAEAKFEQIKSKADKEELSDKEKSELKNCLKIILEFYHPRS